MSAVVSARRRRPSERLGQAPDVVRTGAAADAEVADAELVRVPGELRDLVAVAGERIERRRERASTRDIHASRVA